MDTFKQFVDICAAHPATTITITGVVLYGFVRAVEAIITLFLEGGN